MYGYLLKLGKMAAKSGATIIFFFSIFLKKIGLHNNQIAWLGHFGGCGGVGLGKGIPKLFLIR